MGDTVSRETWTARVKRLTYYELYAEGEFAVTGYDASGSCLWGAPRPSPPLELVDPARRYRAEERPAAG